MFKTSRGWPLWVKVSLFLTTTSPFAQATALEEAPPYPASRAAGLPGGRREERRGARASPCQGHPPRYPQDPSRPSFAPRPCGLGAPQGAADTGTPARPRAPRAALAHARRRRACLPRGRGCCCRCRCRPGPGLGPPPQRVARRSLACVVLVPAACGRAAPGRRAATAGPSSAGSSCSH